MPNINLLQTITTATDNQAYFIVSNNGLVRRFKFENFVTQLQQNIPDANRTDQNLFTNSNVAFATATIGGVTPVTVHDGGMTFNDGTSQYTAYPGFTVSIPSSSTSSGITGQLSFDSSYVYICVGPNQWKRIAASDF